MKLSVYTPLKGEEIVGALSTFGHSSAVFVGSAQTVTLAVSVEVSMDTCLCSQLQSRIHGPGDFKGGESGNGEMHDLWELHKQEILPCKAEIPTNRQTLVRVQFSVIKIEANAS